MSSELKKLIKEAIIELSQGNSDQLSLSLRLESAVENENVNYFMEILNDAR